MNSNRLYGINDSSDDIIVYFIFGIFSMTILNGLILLSKRFLIRSLVLFSIVKGSSPPNRFSLKPFLIENHSAGGFEIKPVPQTDNPRTTKVLSVHSGSSRDL